MTDLAFTSALDLAALIKAREISSTELTQMYIDRIERYDTDINAVVVRTFDRALKDASDADKALNAGQDLGPLHGVPMTIKESYVMANTPTTWGIPEFKENVSTTDGLSVARFRAAGAHFLGKTNVPLQLGDFQSYNDIYGQTGNPFDLGRTPGGSSGGSAAALAAGLTGLEAGSDIGGSIRNPAHFCGVYGHKPTYGVIPLRGHELLPNLPDVDLAVCGPLARSAADLHSALDIMAGPISRDIGRKVDLPATSLKSFKALRVALWANEEMAPVASEISERVAEVGRILEANGAQVSTTARPGFSTAEAHETYMTLLNAVMSMNTPDDVYAQTAADVAALAPGDKSTEAVMARSMVLSHRDWLRYDTLREQHRYAWDAYFNDWDILICPQMALPAFEHDHRPMVERRLLVDNVEQDYFTQLFWSGLITNSYLPSTVFPTGLSRGGLPIGLQAVGAPFRDHRTIEFANLITRHIGGFTPPPAYA
ncbi:MAG: amidase [Proteobacteria bacterium]|nr:amidase [Pseudomonadota bacterium]